MYPITRWNSFFRSLWSGLSIIVFLIILLTPIITLAQEPQKTPEPNLQEKPKDDDVIKVDVNLVNLSVSVGDSYDRLVPGLKKDNFEIYEYEGKAKVKQDIVFFTYDDAPVLVGILPDISGSMSGEKMEYARQAIATFLKTSNRNDEVFVIGFDEKPWLIQEPSANNENTIDSIINKLALIPSSRKRTALYDGVHTAIKKIQEYNKKRLESGKQSLKMVLFLISDGQDNFSRSTFKNIREELKETDIIVYSIVVPPATGSEMDSEALNGKNNLAELSELTGGKAYLPDFPGSKRFPDEGFVERPPLTLGEAVTRIAFELRRQYTLAYYPTNKEHDGKYRKIYVKVIPPKGLPRLTVRAKQGYYAPKY